MSKHESGDIIVVDRGVYQHYGIYINELNTIIFNNCEHFVYWCKTGRNMSKQVSKTMGALAAATLVVIATAIIKNSDEI
jgi:hypothetical protein